MEEFKYRLSSKIRNIELLVLKTDDQMKEFESNLKNYVLKAKETLQKKHVINPKPQKRFMRIITESEESDQSNQEVIRPSTPPVPAVRNIDPVIAPAKPKSPQRESLRPVRTAKANASKNLKEVSSNAKLRNDNNVAVIVKSERVSAASKKLRDSLKENAQPNVARVSVDEGMGSEPDLSKDRDIKRSMSVEIIPLLKPIEIDITDDSADKMPPPPIPGKKKKAQKQSNLDVPIDPTQPMPLRVTRSKIKKEKPSIGKATSSKELVKPVETEENPIQKSISESVLHDQTQKVNDTTTASKKGSKKKYPMPILVKIEKLSIEAIQKVPSPPKTTMPSTYNPELAHNDNENIPPIESAEKPRSFPINETVTINTNLPVNETVTLATNVNETYNKNMHDSLMTEDNDEDSMELPLSQMKESNKVNNHPQLPIKLKTKNEVFNPYLSSPVKQKVQAFEKHAVTTPDKSKATSAKYSTLKSGTPSKIALYGAKTTPLNNAKQKYIAAISGSASSSSTTSLSSNKKPTNKKFTSLSHESNEDLRKNQVQAVNQLEEKRRQREEKQKQVQLQREAIEKQKREQVLQQQREREEKFRKIMQEKEEAKRMEALKKKMQKENQEKKYAEEKARKDEFTLPKEPQSASKDDSLYIKMQKQILLEKSLSQKKKVDKNTYSFEMLNTDDSTDDESHPSKKRPEPPQWSKKQIRSKQIFIQSYANSNLLDTLFSSHPINVNLKEIFPTIDARKLIRNSSAVWNTPPRYSQMPKY